MLLTSKLKKMNLLSEGKSMRYLVYAIGEVLLVAIGLLIALQVDNWDKEQDNRNLERQYYQSMQTQLINDKSSLNSAIEDASELTNKFLNAISIIASNDREQTQSLGTLALELKNYADFRRKSSIFQTLVNSGEIKHIRNSDIVVAFQELEGNYNYIERLEATHQQAIIPIIFGIVPVVQFQPLKVQKPELLFSYEMQNTFYLITGLNDETNSVYQSTVQDIEKLLKLIELELEHPN